MSLLAPHQSIRIETIIDSSTGHTIEVGYWNELWGFHCVTCDGWYARKVTPGFDPLAVMVELVDQHVKKVATIAKLVVEDVP